MITIKDVAKRANVAISTVSNVITGKKYVSEDVKNRVEQAILELNYSTNYVARSMKSKHSMKIGFIALDMCGLFFPYVLKEAYKVANEKGYSITISDSNSDFNREKENITDLIARQVDGIIFSSIVKEEDMQAYSDYLHEQISKCGKNIYLISIERDFTPYGIDSICTNFYPGACEAVSHLIRIGCQHIAHIAAPVGTGDSRYHAFINILKEHGMEVDTQLVKNGDLTHESGYQCALSLIQQKIPFDGIFVANDQMAIGVYQALRENNIKIPDDVKIVGFDDVFINQALNPSLSSVHVQKRLLGKHAMEVLIHQIETGKMSKIHHEILDCHLIVRGSSDPTYDPAQNCSHENW